MRKSWFLPLVVCVLFSIVQTSFAQRQVPNRSDLIAMSGDPDTFGANMQFAGVVISGYVLLDPACVFPPGETLGPEDRCVVLSPAPALTTFDARDIGRITLPANSTKDVLFQLITIARNYQFFNTTGAAQSSAIMNFSPYFTIESDALNDPRAVNPDTGAPLNGKVDIGGLATSVDRSLAVGERIREQANYSRTSINGLSRTYWRAWGFPEDLIQKLLQGQMTVRLNVKGRARLVSDASFQVSARFFGN